MSHRGVVALDLLELDPADDTDATHRPEHESFTRDDVIAGTHSLTITINQDIHYLPDIQAGMRSRGFDHALLNRDEVRLQHFHDWVDYCLQYDCLGGF